MKNSIGGIIVLGFIAVVIYVVFGVSIVQNDQKMNSIVEGYQAGYSKDKSNQGKGLDLIKSNWNRVSKDKSLMQKQIDTVGVTEAK